MVCGAYAIAGQLSHRVPATSGLWLRYSKGAALGLVAAPQAMSANALMSVQKGDSPAHHRFRLEGTTRA
jgi:hypothetical protein